jgi:hypothetical protein
MKPVRRSQPEAGRFGILSAKDIVHYVVSFFVSDVLSLALDPARSESWHEREGA